MTTPNWSFSKSLAQSVPSAPQWRARSLKLLEISPVVYKLNNGKQKRPKKSAQQPNSTNGQGLDERHTSLSTTPPPERVTQHSLIPVRKQLKFVQLKKELDKAASFPAPKTVPYRRRTRTAEEVRQEKEEREAEAALLSKVESKNISLRSLYNTAKRKHPPIILVDGYNLLHKWDKTKDLMFAKDRLEEARSILLEDLGMYSMRRQVRVYVVFDALSTGTDSEELLSTGVTVVYSGSCEADSYIEKYVECLIEKRVERIVAVTDDVAHKAVVDSKKTGDRQICFVIPCSGIIKDMETTRKELKEDLDNQSPVMSLMGNYIKATAPQKFDLMQQLRLYERTTNGKYPVYNNKKR